MGDGGGDGNRVGKKNFFGKTYTFKPFFNFLKYKTSSKRLSSIFFKSSFSNLKNPFLKIELKRIN